jgi:hypothetical protein
MKVPLTEIYKNLDFASDRLSTQIRALILGVLALVWLFLSGNKDVPALTLRTHTRQLLAIAGLCVLTLLIDAIQYWASYLSSNAVRREAEKQNKAEAEYAEGSLMRCLQQGSFWAKQITAIIATAWLLSLLVVSLTQA